MPKSSNERQCKNEGKYIAIIIQARMSSSRLPGKVMRNLVGIPMIQHVINRAKQAKLADEVVVATTTKAVDDELADFCKKSASIFRGSEDDVLGRFYHAAREKGVDVVVRITADCPLVDPQVIDECIRQFLEKNVDYLSNFHPPTFPNGFETEVFSFHALERAWNEANMLSEREHVTPYLWKNPGKFRLENMPFTRDVSNMRVTVDDLNDFIVVERVLKSIGEGGSVNEVVELISSNPAIAKENAKTRRNEGYAKSLRKDIHWRGEQ